MNQYTYYSFIFGGDYSARIGDLNQIEQEYINNRTWATCRSEKDKIVNKKGKVLLKIMKKENLMMLNRRLLSNTSGNYMFVGATGKNANILYGSMSVYSTS